MDACIEQIAKKKVKLIIVAKDASEKTKQTLEFYCDKYQTPIKTWGEIMVISKSIGKQNKAIIGIKDTNFAREIVKLINGGELIG